MKKADTVWEKKATEFGKLKQIQFGSPKRRGKMLLGAPAKTRGITFSKFQKTDGKAC